MNKDLMTDTDVKAACLAQVFKSRNVKGFGATEAKQANDTLVKLFQAQRMDAETFGRVAAYLGNHSAIRQWAIAHGFINSEPDALTNALEAMIEKVAKAEGKALEEIA